MQASCRNNLQKAILAKGWTVELGEAGGLSDLKKKKRKEKFPFQSLSEDGS